MILLPIFFQSNEEFYAITPNCFGKLGLGLATRENTSKSNSFDKEFPEIGASENIIFKKIGRENEKTKFKKGEREHILPLVFGVDSGVVVSLESMANTASELGKIPDDGKIRLIFHYNQYYSHKYGYAADGGDTWLREARVMDREVYFDLIKQKEDKFFNALENPEESTKKDMQNHSIISKAYSSSSTDFSSERPVKIPDSMIITPNLMITFPRSGGLDYRNRDQTWNTEKNIGGGFPVYDSVCLNDRSPFSVYCATNRKTMNAQSTSELSHIAGAYTSEISREISRLRNAMPKIESFLSRINNAHNQCFEEDITSSESLRKRWADEKT